jgi:hypothetical protein
MNWIKLAERNQMVEFCEVGDEPSCSIKIGSFFTSEAAINFQEISLQHGVKEC